MVVEGVGEPFGETSCCWFGFGDGHGVRVEEGGVVLFRFDGEWWWRWGVVEEGPEAWGVGWRAAAAAKEGEDGCCEEEKKSWGWVSADVEGVLHEE